MNKKPEIYQCPCEPACKCVMDEPCLGCETYGEWLNNEADKKENYIRKEELKYLEEKIKVLEKERDDWWSKAKCPDECYIVASEVFKNWIKKEDVVGISEGLIDYCQHDMDCICSQFRKGEPTKEEGFDGYKTLFGYGNNSKWYGRNEYPKCTCGLDQAIQDLKEKKD